MKKVKTKRVEVRLTENEFQRLESLSIKTCLPKASLIRMLIKGYMPKEKPDKDFYNLTKEMYAIGNNLNQLVRKANSLDFVDADKFKALTQRHYDLISEIERQYLKPERNEDLWQ